jgi:hypothetical protein
MSIGVEIRPDAVYTEEVETCTCVDDTTTDTTTDDSSAETTTDTTTDDSSAETTTDTTTDDSSADTTTDTTTDDSSANTTTDESSTDTTTTDSSDSSRRRRLDETTSTDGQTCTCETTTVDVEIDADAEPTYNGHHHATKQIMEIAYEQSYVREEWDIVITNPDDGYFTLNLLSPPGEENVSVTTTSLIPVNGWAWQVRRALNWYYFNYYKCWTTVTKTMYDSAGDETTSSSDAVTIRYRVSPNI